MYFNKKKISSLEKAFLMKIKLLDLGSKCHDYNELCKLPLYLQGDAQVPDCKLYAIFWMMYHFARNQSICQVSSFDQLYLVSCGPNSLYFHFLGAHSMLTQLLVLSLLKYQATYQARSIPGFVLHRLHVLILDNSCL